MPSQIGNGGNIVDIAANYLVAKPSTQFGTRQLSVLKIAIADVFVNYADSNSLFSKSVRALQQTAEVWAVFTPVNDTDDYFHVIIATDTQWAGDTAHQGAVNGGSLPTQGYGVLETAIAAGNGGTAATVTAPTGFVAPFHG
jgi:hypothetical protein